MQLRESQMTGALGAWLEAQGYEWFVEVPHYETAIDIIARKGERLLSIEMKTTLSKHVIHQARLAQLSVHASYVAIPTKPRQTGLDRCRELSVGVLRVTEEVEE